MPWRSGSGYGIQAYVTPEGAVRFDHLTTSGGYNPPRDGDDLLPPGLRTIRLTPDQATELRQRLAEPTTTPPRGPHPVPVGDPSLLMRPTR